MAVICRASVTKLPKGEIVNMEALMKICKALDCNIGDIMNLIPQEEASIRYAGPCGKKSPSGCRTVFRQAN